MHRTLEYRIDDLQTPCTIQEYLTDHGFSSQNFIALKKSPDLVLLNGSHALLKTPLSKGDLITIHIIEEESSPKIIPVKLPLDIIYEDEDILVINKPADTPIHPSMDNYDNTVANALMYYFNSNGIPFVFRCINRLDRDTSGLTIIAKHSVSAGILSSRLQADHTAISREYLAIVKGVVNPPCGTIDAPIRRREESIIERIVDLESGDRAVTHYETLETTGKYSLLSLHLETGRTHQIRVHMKHIGSPLVGDSLYNPEPAPMTRQALHSYRLIFRHPITDELMDFTCPLPEDMRSCLYS